MSADALASIATLHYRADATRATPSLAAYEALVTDLLATLATRKLADEGLAGDGLEGLARALVRWAGAHPEILDAPVAAAAIAREYAALADLDAKVKEMP